MANHNLFSGKTEKNTLLENYHPTNDLHKLNYFQEFKKRPKMIIHWI